MVRRERIPYLVAALLTLVLGTLNGAFEWGVVGFYTCVLVVIVIWTGLASHYGLFDQKQAR